MSQSCSNSCADECGSTARPVAVLKQEHRLIEQGLDALECVMREDRVDPAFMRQAIEFFRGFADVCHHAKEEEHLFPALEKRGLPRESGPIGCMLHDHAMGRALVRGMSEGLDRLISGDAGAEETIRQGAAKYIDLLRHHIQKEDNILFLMADRLIDESCQSTLGRAFEDVEHSKENVGRRERVEALLVEMRNRAAGASKS